MKRQPFILRVAVLAAAMVWWPNLPAAAQVGPEVTTLHAITATDNSATLHGVVNPNGLETAAWFEWGATTDYGQLTAVMNVGARIEPVSITGAITGLTAGATYCYRTVAAHSSLTNVGGNRSFVCQVLNVTTLDDSGAGSLRNALAFAPAGATVRLATAGTITLTNGELKIGNDVNLVGSGATNLAISGNRQSRVFHVASNVMVTMSGLTIRDGQGAAGASAADGSPGGGVHNAGSLTLNRCIIAHNQAENGGDGAPGAAGAPNVPDGNPGSPGSAGGSGGAGGGIYNDSSGVLTLDHCMVEGNAGGAGGVGGSSMDCAARSEP
ncbi:MAG TPA: hypothetical protein P5525_17855, partial [Candidatus Paceibacterota bacterium]|nr:hypothetical protein [Candidatus Paceibacterota bacterium]